MLNKKQELKCRAYKGVRQQHNNNITRTTTATRGAKGAEAKAEAVETARQTKYLVSSQCQDTQVNTHTHTRTLKEREREGSSRGKVREKRREREVEDE